MRAILRTLPIRWQITLLHATILALVLAAGGFGVWNAQRSFLYDSVVAKQLPEVLALMPEDQDPKFLAEQKSDPVLLKKYLAALVQEVSAKDLGVAIMAPDGALLMQNSTGPACVLPAYLSKDALAAKAGNDFFNKLRMLQYLRQVEPGQLTVLVPVIWQKDRPLALAQICVPTDAIDANLNQLAASLAVGWVLVIGLATALGVTATRRVLRPLDRVVATTGRIAGGDLKQRVGLPPGRTEIAQLGAAFDAMVTRLEAAFAAQRRFVADAAHELRTPLTALTTSVELLLMGAADNDRATAQRLLRHLDSELGRVIRLTNDLLTLSQLDARQQRLAPRPTDLSALLEEQGEHNRALLRGQELIVDVAPGLSVHGDPDRLRQVVLNLLDNARKYTPPGGRITLRAGSECSVSSSKSLFEKGEPERDAPPSTGITAQDRIVIEVADTGVGIPADALPHLFERFYRVDGARARASGGSGLGLAIVQAIVQAHGGQVSLRSAPGQGTCVTILLPRLPDTSMRSDSPQGHIVPTALPAAET